MLRSTSVRPSILHCAVWFAASVIGAACASAPAVAPQAPADARDATGTGRPFPWPPGPARSTEPSCARAAGHIDAGLALESEVWLTVSCTVAELERTGRSREVDAFVQAVRAFRDNTDFYKVKFVDTPEALKADLGMKPEIASVILYATRAQRDANPAIAQKGERALGPGGYRGLCLPWRGVGGHYQVTGWVVDALGPSFPTTLKNLMADASQDPDIFRWTTMAAHGQTKDDGGVPSESAYVAQQAWRGFVKEWLTTAKTECGLPGDEHVRKAAYAFAFALHSVEDVAPHRGRTNPEHAYQALHGQSPDDDPGIDRLAYGIALEMANAALAGPLATCKERFQAFPAGTMSFEEKEAAFGFHLDGTPLAYAEYEASSRDFAKHSDAPGASVRWFGPPGAWPQGVACRQDPGCAALLDTLLADVRAIH